MELQTFVKKWAQENAGLLLKAHQLSRVLKDVEAYLIKNKLSNEAFINALNKKNENTVEEFLNILTVQESYFFRDASVFNHLEKNLLPNLIKRNSQHSFKKINIWSAGCSHGEEIYSMVILLEKLLVNQSDWHIHFYATDINHKALINARKAIYSKSSLRASDADFIRNYFDEIKNAYQLKEHLKKQVRFEFFNVSETPAPNMVFDIIFCRNVFIYLTNDAIQHALETFHKSLNDEGVLFLGPSDLISHQSHKFKLNICDGTSVLTKVMSSNTSPVINRDKTPEKSIRQGLSYAEKQKNKGGELRNISSELIKKNYANVIMLADDYLTTKDESALVYRYKSEALIHLGDIDTANHWLTKAINLNKLDPKSYFLKALTSLAKPLLAKSMFKKALYLNSIFPEAHYHLAQLLLREKNTSQGIKHLVKAKEMAVKKTPTALVIFSDETMSTFIASLNKEITYYQGLNNESS